MKHHDKQTTGRLANRESLIIAILMTAAGVFATAQPAAAETMPKCSDHTLNVTLAPGETETFQLAGTLCSQGPAAGKTVQILLHGSTYARYYWDFPYQTEHYSYVRAATKRGYATFNLDRIGYGASAHPDGNRVDIDANAFVVHQVVEALRAGEVASQRFEKVMVVGHSMGSFTAVNYAGSFPGEADGIILTGFLHDLSDSFINSTFAPAIYPATLDEKFAGQFPNSDYLTTMPGTRGDLFYYLPNANPEVLALDEALKQTVTVGELGTGLAMVSDPISFQIKGPVQVVIGEFDYVFCGNLVNCSDKAAVQNYEKAFYSAEACVDMAVISDSGHDLNLHTNANAAYSQMLSWADRTVGSTAGAAPQPCGTP
ncbi:alpha/beta hydrolase [Methylobacter sp. sgz302048]|uniref:alpha/beta hydrolase n=1 Tax=Methylobacter sp. sgz302048 TaxID=3455945 RepID=UPI003FA0AB8A